MSAALISPAAIERLRTVARQKGVLVWVDHPARNAGKPFIWLQRKGCTLAEFWDDEEAMQWLGVKP
jgi:hypothetical protein